METILHKAKRNECDKNGKTLILESEYHSFISGSIATPSLFSELVSLKVEHGMPEYRISNLWKVQGLDLSCQTINSWIQKAGSLLSVLSQRILSDFRELNVVMMVETTLKCHESGPSKSTVIVGCSANDLEKQIIVYKFRPDKKQQFVDDLLGNFYTGILMSDGAKAYINYPGCIHCVDFTHARRYFIEAMEVCPDWKEFKKLKTIKDRKHYLKNCKDKTFCAMAQILLDFGTLFHIESALKEKQAGTDQIVATRSEKSLPVFTSLLSKIEKHSSGSLLQGKDSKAYNYFINHAAQLQEVLFHGNCAITTNKVERCVKSFVLQEEVRVFQEQRISAPFLPSVKQR